MISLEKLRFILNNNDPNFVESLAREARDLTIRHFGRTISLYTPLYLSNYCENQCDYCGYNQKTDIPRKKLTKSEIKKELKAISATGIQNILLLTGGSRKETPIDYLIAAVKTAKPYFPSISLEVYPLEKDEYSILFRNGVDGITIYQETYDREQYKKIHQAGKKTDFNYRYNSPERIANSGIRMLGMGVLLGLSETSKDIYHLFSHLEYMENKYPGVEYSLSFPRLIPLKQSEFKYNEVSDLTLIKLICTARILFPRIGINLSTREKPQLRNQAILMGVTKISAASKTTVGGYSFNNENEGQFEVRDQRSVEEIIQEIKNRDYDPIFTDWRRISNLSFIKNSSISR